MKERITVSIDQDLLDWMDQQTHKKVFANRSHGFEYLIKSAELQDEDTHHDYD